MRQIQHTIAVNTVPGCYCIIILVLTVLSDIHQTEPNQANPGR